MAEGTPIDDIRLGMLACSADGKRLGKVTHIHRRDTDTYVEVTPEANRWKPWQWELKRLFLPGDTVAEVTEKQVRLAMDAKTAKGCTWRPHWIEGEAIDYVKGMIAGGGS